MWKTKNEGAKSDCEEDAPISQSSILGVSTVSKAVKTVHKRLIFWAHSIFSPRAKQKLGLYWEIGEIRWKNSTNSLRIILINLKNWLRVISRSYSRVIIRAKSLRLRKNAKAIVLFAHIKFCILKNKQSHEG